MTLGRLHIGIILAAGAAGLFTIYTAHRVRADGIPATPMTYAGVLEDANGPVDSGKLPIQVSLYDGPDDGASNVCAAALDMIDFTDKRGRFELTLAANCTTAVQAQPDLYVDIQVAGVPQLPRPKLGAVPFAIEAGRASAATGSLSAQLAMLEAKVAALEDQLAALEAKRPVFMNGAKTYSLDAKFCGFTANSFTGNLGGYTGAKTACEATCSSPTAHMCTSEELIRYRATGGTFVNPPAFVWFASGVFSRMAGPINLRDCAMFTSSDGANEANGALNGGALSFLFCDTQARIACCD